MQKIMDNVFKIVVLAGMVVLLTFQFRGQQKVVYVDALRLVNGYKGVQSARAGFEERVKDYKSKLDTLQHELQADIDFYTKHENSLAKKDKALLQESIGMKQEQFIQYQKTINEKINKEQTEINQSVMTTLNGFLKKYGEEKGYDVILAATEYGNIAYAKEAIDVTDDVLSRLNTESLMK